MKFPRKIFKKIYRRPSCCLGRRFFHSSWSFPIRGSPASYSRQFSSATLSPYRRDSSTWHNQGKARYRSLSRSSGNLRRPRAKLAISFSLMATLPPLKIRLILDSAKPLRADKSFWVMCCRFSSSLICLARADKFSVQQPGLCFGRFCANAGTSGRLYLLGLIAGGGL